MRRAIVTSILLVCSIDLRPGWADTMLYESAWMLQKPASIPNGWFGGEVAALGHQIVIGSPADPKYSAAVSVFDTSTGSLVKTLQNPSPQGVDSFGGSLAVAGNSVLVGAPGTIVDPSFSTRGTAYLFDGSSGEMLWTIANPLRESTSFASEVVSCGNIFAIGVPNARIGRYRAGRVYLYDAATGGQLSFIDNPNPNGLFFGQSMAGDDNRLLITCPGDRTVRLYDVPSGTLLHTFNKHETDVSYFGDTVAIQDNRILITDHGYDTPSLDHAGAVFLYDAESGDLLHTFVSPEPAFGENFGWSACFVGDDILVGANDNDRPGRAYLLDGSTGELLQSFESFDPQANDLFGYEVAAVGNDIVVTAPTQDPDRLGLGAAYVFRLVPEPSSLALLCGAVLLLMTKAYWHRRRTGGRRSVSS